MKKEQIKLDIILPIHKNFVYLLETNEKKFEFRNKLGKNVKCGTKVYVYETGKQNGRKQIVGEFVISKIYDLSDVKFGYYWIIDWYCEYILKDIELSTKFKIAKDLPKSHYKLGSWLNFALSEKCIQYIKDTNEWPKFSLIIEETELIKKAEEIILDVDKYLTKIGYYNSYDESFFSYALEFKNYKKYETPIPITKYLNKNKELIKTAPQNFHYTLGVKF